MKKSIGLIFASVLAAALVAGCNSGSNNNNNGFGTNCGAPPAGFQMIYPQNNAPRVPPNNVANGVYVAAKPPLVVGNSYNFLPVEQGGSLPYTSTFAVYSGPLDSIPKPHNTPVNGSTVYFANFLYPIGPAATVQLYWNDGGTGCNPNVIVSTFTTAN